MANIRRNSLQADTNRATARAVSWERRQSYGLIVFHNITGRSNEARILLYTLKKCLHLLSRVQAFAADRSDANVYSNCMHSKPLMITIVIFTLQKQSCYFS